VFKKLLNQLILDFTKNWKITNNIKFDIFYELILTKILYYFNYYKYKRVCYSIINNVLKNIKQ